MISKLTKLLLVIIALFILGSTCFASTNSVTLYADYGNGFEFFSDLSFDKSVSEKTLTIDKNISSLRIVRGECYDLNLDRLTLNGVSPKGFERKLKATDKDLLEVVDTIDFELEGKGELVISARAPKDIKGEEYSAKFPTTNRGVFIPSSDFYNYTLGTNYGSFSDADTMAIPAQEYLFKEENVKPDSGHPEAPIDFYIANDEDTLYVFFEAFVDNTLDNGKDFAGVHIKCEN